MSYSYDLVGDLRSASNGVGVNFTYFYNTAPRLTTVTSSLVDTQHPATLLNNIHYGPFGVASDTLGNGLSETIGYNPLGFLNSYSSSRYSFSLTGLAGNGTITAVNDSANGNWTYTYDQFNRLASSNKSTSPVQGFSYAYDRYGNRWQQNLTVGSGPQPQYLLDNTTNRINGSGITYDALGNMLTDGLGNSYTWDAENRLIKVNGGATATYTYDAEGRRVKNSSTEFLYDLAGRAVTLLDASTGGWAFGEIYAGGRHLATYSGSTTNFLHTDWLGTKRVMSSITGAQSQTCTSLPFGDALNCSGTEWNFSHFTDYMHDGEDNLEHTWFRQYSTTQGRFTAADPYRASMTLNNPQSLNRYVSVLNNPVNFIDPLGLVCSGNVGELYDTPCNPANYGGGGGSGGFGFSSDLDFLGWALNNPQWEIVDWMNVGNCDACMIPLVDLVSDLSLLNLFTQPGWSSKYNYNRPAVCQGITPDQFDYTTPQMYMAEDQQGTVIQSAQQHIQHGHIFPGETGNTMYGFYPRLNTNAAFQAVKNYNATTFTYGAVSQASPTSNIVFTYTFPVIINPFNGLPAFIGYDAYAPLGVEPLSTNKFVLGSNCKLVRTSFPTYP